VAVEPGNAELAKRLLEVQQLREQHLITLPSNIALEKASNPFLRCLEPSVKDAAEQKAQTTLQSASEVFATLRTWKDTF
ncbi:MAG: hydroxyacylglutathione hydrolase, partial [Shewanella sp.]|nr:hydroxyacylglutathione hydrolase [Shewanella sp.]